MGTERKSVSAVERKSISGAGPTSSAVERKSISGADKLAASLQGPRSDRGSVVVSDQRPTTGPSSQQRQSLQRASLTAGIQNPSSEYKEVTQKKVASGRASLISTGSKDQASRVEENSDEPVLHLSVGVPAWGIQKQLKLTLTAESFRRVHQRLEKFANDAAERDGATTYDRMEAYQRMELERDCSKEFEPLVKRYQEAKEFLKSRRSIGLGMEDDAEGEMRNHRGSVTHRGSINQRGSVTHRGSLTQRGSLIRSMDQGPVADQQPVAAWMEGADEAAVNSAIEQLQNRAEQLKAQLEDAERSLELAEQRRETAENRLKVRMAAGRKRESATQTDADEEEVLPVVEECPVERGSTPSFADIGTILQSISAMEREKNYSPGFGT